MKGIQRIRAEKFCEEYRSALESGCNKQEALLVAMNNCNIGSPCTGYKYLHIAGEALLRQYNKQH